MNSGQAIPAEKLADYIGKETADKLIKKAEGIKPYEPITKLPEGYHLIHDSNGVAKGEEWGIIPPGQKHARNFTGERYLPTEQDAINAALDKINREGRHKYERENSVLENIDLKVGGEGMKGFYDQILPAAANKLVKKYGAKVERSSFGGVEGEKGQGNISERPIGGYRVDFPDGHSAVYAGWADAEKALATAQETHSVHSLDITPALRETAVGKGFPLFAAGVPIPSDQNNRYKLVPIDHDPFTGAP